MPSLDPKDLLPLGIEITKGAITCGNNSTPNLLVAEFRRSEGTFGLIQARSKLDLYKQSLLMSFQQAVVRYVNNDNYVDPMTSMGELVHGRIVQYSTLNQPSYLSYRSFTDIWKRFRLLNLARSYTRDRREVHAMQRQGLSKGKKKNSQDENTPLGTGFGSLEYAIDRRLLETPLLEVSYFFDVVGDVPVARDDPETPGVESDDIGNGDIAPDWGFDIVINGGTLRYGPWADRQRSDIQRVFFPPNYQDGAATTPLKPGDKRLWTAMRVFVELRDNTVLHIPFREPSKACDWQWDGQSEIPKKSRIREATAIHVTVGDRSSISYTLPMVAGPHGYQPVLEVHLDTVVVHCEMPTPLKWNEARKWLISLSLRQPVLYLIRDHINMFIDLGKDWTTGPPSDYQRFIPMIYAFEIALYHYELNVYVNDHNIIDKPLLRDDNALLTLRGAHFKATTDISSCEYRPESTTIPFTIYAPESSINLSLPRWNTNALHAPKSGNSLANLRFLRLDGSYQYFADIHPDHVEMLKLRFDLKDVAFKNFGWSIRYFMVFKENYLGSFTHFATLYEYLDRRKRNQPIGDPLFSKYRPGKNNMLQAEMQVFVDAGTIIMPVGLPGYSASWEGKAADIGECLILTVPNIQLQFRMHDHFMEMSLNIENIFGGLIGSYPEKVTYKQEALQALKNIFHVDGLDITANRLFGPQPRNATYVCIWEFNLGSIDCLLSASEARLLAAAGNAFRLNFTDAPNSPANEYLPHVDPDVTFVKVSLGSLNVVWKAGLAAFVIGLRQGLRLDSNDLGGRFHRKSTSVKIPEITLKVLLASALYENRWLEAGHVSADAYLDVYSASPDFQKIAQAQASFIAEQDDLTGRARRMVASLRSQKTLGYSKPVSHVNGVYLTQPKLPEQRRIVGTIPAAARTESTQVSHMNPLHLSDSDAEEGVSEADRDARLAKTRSSTPIARFISEENQNMSSGDESDDEDLTDTSSDAEWFDHVGPAGLESDSRRTTMRHYSQVTRHYAAPSLESPGLWDGCPFILVRDCPRLTSATSETYDDPELEQEKTASPRPHSDGNQESNYLLFKGQKAVSIKVTPMLLLSLVHFEEDIRKNPLSLELCIDSMMASHLSEMTTSQQSPYFAFEASIRHVTVQILQRISMTDGHPTISRHSPQAEEATVLDAISVVQAVFRGVSISGSVLRDHFFVQTSVTTSSIGLDISIDKRTIEPSLPDKFVSDCHIDGLTFSAANDSFTVIWIDSRFRIGHLGPEYMVATGLALGHKLAQLSEPHKKWRQHSSQHRQAVVFDVIRNSEDKATVDPLSTIQPSYLVQSGLPHMLRIDVTFRFLYHLRNCLWHLGPSDRQSIRSDNVAVNQVDLVDLMEARLAALDPDAYNVLQMPPLQSLLLILHIVQRQATPVNHPPVFNSITVKFANLSLVILDPEDKTPSELAIADVDVRTRIFSSQISQPPSLNLTTQSQTSLREKRSQHGLKSSTLVSLGAISFTVSPHLMGFAQHILRVRRQYLSIPWSTKEFVSPPLSSPAPAAAQFVSADIIVTLMHLRIQAAAENLVFEYGLTGLRGVFSVLSWPPTLGGQSMNQSVLFDHTFIRARSPSDMAKQNDHDILASLELKRGKVSTTTQMDLVSKSKIHLVFSLGDLQLFVPRSALRLYRFIQEWRADFLPGIEATLQTLRSEIDRTPKKVRSPQLQRASSGYASFHIQGELSHVGVALQVMHGTWLSWEATDLTAHTSSISHGNLGYSFGLQIASVFLSISSRPNAPDEELGTRIKIVLPPLRATGHYDGREIHTLVLINFAELKVKPSYWDALLTIQQKFGQDFHDLVTLIQETNLRRTVVHAPKNNTRGRIKYNAFVKMHGFRIGFEGPASTVFFECLDIGGGINNLDGLTYNLELLDVAFSLAPRVNARYDSPGFNRNHRSAFVIVDFKIDAHSETNTHSNTIVQVSVTKIHAVMQPSSIGEVGDFIDHLQAEMLDRKTQRALELTAFKEKTRRILQTFEVGVQDTSTDTRPWLDGYIINISTRNVGVAFPLTLDQDLQLPTLGSRDSVAVPAFLWSIKSIEFGTNRGQTGQAEMRMFSFQFVSRFRQSVPDDFSGENHINRNRLVYPQMRAQVRSTPSTARRMYVQADVSGFVLDLDSSIPSYIFSLIDVYRQGRDRVEKISNNLPRSPSALDAQDTGGDFREESTRSALPTSSLFASMTFRSGKVRVYSGAASKLYRARAFPYNANQQELSDDQVMELGAEVFNLPEVSVWAEYHATPTTRSLLKSNETEPSILMFKSTVHSSQNTLRPTLLPFVMELVSHIESRLRRVSLRASHPEVSPMQDRALHAPNQDLFDSASNLQISFSLRIDQSKLELTCQPDVNVIAGLHWDSGGFVVSVSPGARKVTFTGSVGGLTIGLKHGFLSEDCVRLDARNLAFSVAYAKFADNEGEFGNSFSVVLDTEFLGVVRFSRLQDILCFKAVWLDRIPIFNNPPPSGFHKAPTGASSPLSQGIRKPQFTTALLIRIRRIILDVDLGQSISATTLDLRDAVMRTKLTEMLHEVSVFVDILNIMAKGNVAGNAHVPKCVFQTVRSTDGSFGIEGRNQMLELNMTSGPLSVALESDNQKLLDYQCVYNLLIHTRPCQTYMSSAEPLEIKIYDNWPISAPKREAQAKPLRLSFTVKSPDIVAVATVGTIPKLLAYVNKFKANLDAQRLGASRESKAFRITRTPKPDNPLSAVAEAMLASARSRFKEMEDELNYVIMQNMTLELNFLRLVVFPRTMDDLEIAQFVARDVKAKLDRLVESEPTAGQRDLLLSFSSMNISKFTGLGHPNTAELSDGRTWLVSLLRNASEATIAGLPSMTMHMVSEEKVEDLTTTLVYDFYSQFVRQGDSREYQDIYITLNVALYSWLTVLRKNLTREMEQVKASTDWRTLLNTAPTSTHLGENRKRIPEPLNLSSPRSSTEPSPTNKPYSPFSPTTALKSSMGNATALLSPPHSVLSSARGVTPGLQDFPLIQSQVANPMQPRIVYQPRSRHIERLTMRQLGEATPDVMHPFFMKKAGFNLEDSLPQYVNEYATKPLEEIMEMLLKVYSRQLLSGSK
ncbi:hypothetical protein H0H93_007348 [Arthromyces matolae]|nr:hypothetical protein H0H93_007348 [Arthromyces matolae]